MKWVLYLALWFLWMCFSVYILVINGNDMLQNGRFDFWPVFWVLLILSLNIGGSASARDLTR